MIPLKNKIAFLPIENEKPIDSDTADSIVSFRESKSVLSVAFRYCCFSGNVDECE